jgi:ferredoxin-NADP reductase/nitrite reductase/ring-hydroxylating ferredoxin subunit
MDTVFALRDEAGVRVFANICPHEGTPLGWRKDGFLVPDGSAIMCFAHGARFDKVSGLCFAGPCEGQTLTALPFEITPSGDLCLRTDSPQVAAIVSARKSKAQPDNARELPFYVIVRHIYHETAEIRAIRLEALRGKVLPTFTAGAHIQVKGPGEKWSSYSIASGAAERSHYTIGVRLAEASTGGSQFLHESVRGDRLLIMPPKNTFPLHDGARHTLLFGAGIGVTPLLSMAADLHRRSQDFTLHYCAASRHKAAFFNLINQAGFRDKVRFYFSDDGASGRLDMAAQLAAWKPKSHLYVCGPRSFMQTALQTADELGWPGDTLHYEIF